MRTVEPLVPAKSDSVLSADNVETVESLPAATDSMRSLSLTVCLCFDPMMFLCRMRAMNMGASVAASSAAAAQTQPEYKETHDAIVQNAITAHYAAAKQSAKLVDSGAKRYEAAGLLKSAHAASLVADATQAKFAEAAQKHNDAAAALTQAKQVCSSSEQQRPSLSFSFSFPYGVILSGVETKSIRFVVLCFAFFSFECVQP